MKFEILQREVTMKKNILSFIGLIVLLCGFALPVAANKELPNESEMPEETKAPSESDVPEETETPSESDVPEETETPSESEVPGETEEPSESDVPEDSEEIGIPSVPEVIGFPDVPQHYWAHKEITFLTNAEVIFGFPDGKFKPLNTIIRKDAAMMLVRAMKVDSLSETENSTIDINETINGYQDVLAVINRGMLTVENSEFKPYEPLTRKEMAKALAVAIGYEGKGNSNFADVAVSDVYYPYIDAIAENGVTKGYNDGTFKPDEIVTRAQFSAFLARIYSEPIEFTVEQNGQVLQTVQGMDKAIQVALETENATVHPVDNTLKSFSNQTGLLEQTGIKNGVLIYNGAERKTGFSKEYYKPYLVRDLANNTGTMFDTFVILGRTYSNNIYFAESPKNTADYHEWLWYLNQTFAENGALATLNETAKEANQKVNVYISIPYPKRQGDIIDFYGESHENTLEERKKLVDWYLKSAELEWDASQFENLNFKGYYWLNETVTNYEDEVLVRDVSAYIALQNQHLIYSPHALSSNFEYWEQIGFDGAFLQPNAFKMSGKDAEYRLHQAFIKAQIYGSGINVEINSYGPTQMVEGLENFKQYVDIAKRYELAGRSLIFYQDTEMVYRMATYTEPGYNEAYQLLQSIIK